jgi:hypothetical protein
MDVGGLLLIWADILRGMRLRYGGDGELDEPQSRSDQIESREIDILKEKNASLLQ